MNRDTLLLIELLLVFGGVLGWAVWELWSVRRSLREDRARAAARSLAPAPPSDAPSSRPGPPA